MSFQETLRTDLRKISTSLSHINLLRCDCYLQSDKDQIFEIVRNMDGGLDYFNNKVMKLFRAWLQQAAKSMVTHFFEEGLESIDEVRDLG